MVVPHENFYREIGPFRKQRFTTEGEPFTGTDEEWKAYLHVTLPTAQDEEDLKELFKQEWVANKPLSARQIASGIGAKA